MPVTALAISRVDVGDRLEHALAEISGFVAVAEFQGFVFAGGSAGRNGGAAERARLEKHVGFNGGIAARIEDLAGVNASDFGRHNGDGSWVKSNQRFDILPSLKGGDSYWLTR